MIDQAGWWTQTPSATPLQSEKWNARFWITFNFSWSAGLVVGLKPHLPPLSSHKNEMLIFGLRSTSDDWPAGRWTWIPYTTPIQPKKWNPHFWITFNFWWLAGLICHPSPAKKIKYSFLDYVQLLMISWAGQWTRTPSANPLQLQKMKCSFLVYVQLLMIGRAGRWTRTLSATPLQPIKWNTHFWITFNFWWLAGLVDGLEPHPPPLSSQKNKMLVFGLCSTSDDRPGWLLDSSPIHHPSPAKKKMLIFGLHSTSEGQPGCSMCHPSPAKKMKCSFLDYVQLLMIDQAGRWIQTPSATPLQLKKMKCSFLDYVQLLMISRAGQWTRTPSATPLQPIKWNTHFWITFNFWWLAGLVDGLEPHPPPLSSQKNKMLVFGLCSTSDDRLGWSIDSNRIRQPSPANKMKS